MPIIFATARCFAHGELFDFDPARVQSVLICPETNRPPDVAADGTKLPDDDPGVIARTTRSVAQPVCPACCKAMNILARELGLPDHWDETDTAEALIHP